MTDSWLPIYELRMAESSKEHILAGWASLWETCAPERMKGQGRLDDRPGLPRCSLPILQMETEAQRS